MKKIIALVIVIGIFIFGAVSVHGSLTSCEIKEHTMERSGNTVAVNGNVGYRSSSGGAHLYYELDYVYDYFELPICISYVNGVIRTQFKIDYSAIGNLKCWQETLTVNFSGGGGMNLWSKSKASVTTGRDTVSAVYGGTSKANIEAISSKIA